MKLRKKQIACYRRGTTAVEVAIVLPILLMLFFGAIDFSRANTIRNTVENAAYEGARRAVVPGATSQSAELAAQHILASLKIRGATVVATPSNITNGTKEVSVTITVPLGSNLYVSSQMLSSSSISRTCKLTREQFIVNNP